MNKIVEYFFQDKHIVKTILSEESLFFNAKDVCLALEYSNLSKALISHITERGIVQHEILLSDGKVASHYITEVGLQAFLQSSKMKKAKVFKGWVESDVLPKVKEMGKYALPTKPVEKLSSLLQKACDIAIGMEREAEGLKDVRSKAISYEAFLESKGQFTFLEAAKIISVSEKRIIDVCVASAVLYRLGGSGLYMPVEEYIQKGFFTFKDVRKGTALAIKVLVTPLGVDFIKGLINKK